MNQEVYAFLNSAQKAAVKASKTASDAAYLAGKSAESALSQAKLNLRIAELKGDVKELYRELGEMLYAAHASGVSADYDAQLEKLRKLDEMKGEIAALEVQAGRAVTVHLCATCGAEVREGDAYCGECGSKL